MKGICQSFLYWYQAYMCAKHSLDRLPCTGHQACKHKHSQSVGVAPIVCVFKSCSMAEKLKTDMKVIYNIKNFVTWMVHGGKNTYMWSVDFIFEDVLVRTRFLHSNGLHSPLETLRWYAFQLRGYTKSSASADVSTACRTTYWLNLAYHGMAWHSCNVILGFIVNAFISVYHHLSKHNKGPNWSSMVVLLDYCGLTDSQCPAVVAGLWRTDVSLSLQQLEHIVHFCARVFYRPLGVHPIIRFARGRVSLGFRAGKQAELFPILSYLQSGYIHQNWLERQRIRGCKIGH